MKICRLILCLLSLILSGSANQYTKASQQWPDWCLNPPQVGSELLYFSGMSNPQSTETKAKDEAKARAAGNVLDYIGTEIRSKTMIQVKRRKENNKIVQTIKNLDSYTEKETNGVVRNLNIIKWHIDQSSTSQDYSVCVLVEIRQDEIVKLTAEAEKRVKDLARINRSKVQSLIKASEELAKTGDVIPALENLNKAKQIIVGSRISDEKLNVAMVEIREQSILANLSFQARTPTSNRLDSSKNPVVIGFQVVYGANGTQLPVSDFPLLVTYGDKEEAVYTDTSGKGSYSVILPSGSSRTSANVHTNRNVLTSRLSETALNGITLNQIKYEIIVLEENLISNNLRTDFNLSLWADDQKATYRIGDPFKVNYSCYTRRCYIKIFAFEKSGPVFLMRDSKQYKLTVNEQRSFQLAGETPGTISLYAIASLKEFPAILNTKRSFKRTEFRHLIETLRNSKGKKAEYNLNIRITK